MTNRQVAVLVLLASTIVAVGTFYLFFVRNVSELRIGISGPETATVKIMKGAANVLAVECEKECTLQKIPPFDYELIVVADGWIDYRERLSIRSRDRIYRIVEMRRDVKTEPYAAETRDRVAELRGKRSVMSDEMADAALRTYLGHYREKDYFTDENPSFRLVQRDGDGKDEVLFSTENPNASAIVSSDGLVWVDAGGASSLFDLQTGKRHFPSLPAGISKVERTPKDGRFVFSDAKDAYVFDSVSKAVEKTAAYGDVVIRGNGTVLALVRKGDEKRASLLNLGDASLSYVFVDSLSGNREVVYSTDKAVKHIFSAS
jgi:hypothetical protein